MAGRIQGADIKTSTEIVNAGGTIAQLPTDDQSYVTANSINKTLKQAIIDGDISGGQTALTFAKSLITQTAGSMGTSSGGYIQQDAGALIENSLPTALVVTNDATDGVKYTVLKAGAIFINCTYANNNTTDWVKIYKNGVEYKGRGVSAMQYSGSGRDDVSSTGFSDLATAGDVYQFKFNTTYLSTLLNAWGSQATLVAGGGANSIYDIQFGSYVTADGTRSSTSYGATTNPISITFTPVANCIYKISCPFNFYGTAGNTNKFIIQNTVGSATLVSQADVIQDATSGYYGTFNDEAIAYYSLSAGVSYTFELWCKSSGGGTITINNSGTTSGTKMIAEAVGFSHEGPLAARYESSGSISASTSTPWDFSIKAYDTHNAVTTGSGWKFTAPSDGYYQFNVSGLATGVAFCGVGIYKNGSSYEALFNTPSASETKSGSTSLYLLKGDYIDLRPDQPATMNSNGRISIYKIK